ncbi:MAG: aspartate-semialdehyde dehydrogenase [Candidatus Kapabacteria bacterium]|nr:aspartate-semialdehyde dehydrogenase [Candidatus Kapabacteria bacterium]
MIELKIAIVGASGLVGRKMIQVLEERDFPLTSLKLLASSKSAGEKIIFRGKELIIEELNELSFNDVDIALFSAGSDISKLYAPIAVKNRCLAIDNSSYWRLNENTPLVVPEVNSNHLRNHSGIIANPNCSTIQLMVALKPISDLYGLKRVICSTYQSISGAGQKGMDKLNYEIETGESKDKHKIAFNAIFHPIDESLNSVEENKMMAESKKILDLPHLKINVTCVRLPILGGHAESVNVETNYPFAISDIKKCLSSFEGIKILDNPSEEEYPTPFIANDTDEVYIGRIREDSSSINTFNMWVVADNLRKGAATNAVQIAEKVIEMNLLMR